MLGVPLILGGHSVVSVGLHPYQTSFGVLVPGGAALVLGTALFVSGMLGLAEGYERLAVRVASLLVQKQPLRRHDLPASSASGLAAHSRGFWHSYRKVAAGVLLFMMGVFALAIALQEFGQPVFLAGVAGAVAVLGSMAMVMILRGTRAMRRAHVDVHMTARVLERQPEPTPTDPVLQPRRAPAYELFRSGPSHTVDASRSRSNLPSERTRRVR